MSPIGRSPFIASVEPVETRSTIASATPEPRGDLDGARERDDVDGDRLAGEEAPGDVRVGRRDAATGEVARSTGTASRSGTAAASRQRP